MNAYIQPESAGTVLGFSAVEKYQRKAQNHATCDGKLKPALGFGGVLSLQA
ncbi:hypothetical protein [Limnohabitans sp.]